MDNEKQVLNVGIKDFWCKKIIFILENYFSLLELHSYCCLANFILELKHTILIKHNMAKIG